MYEFNWEGKELAYKLAQIPSSATLRPCKEESKDWDTTENIYIEGDNLEVLKQLQKTYYGKVKMIYIDPPYNTGNDFIYKDNFRDNIANYQEITNQSTKVNPETNGRFHTNWLNMMYPRLKIARNLLSEDGIILISIDEYEFHNLKKICDEIFGEDNFVGNIPRKTKSSTNDANNNFNNQQDYILVYRKSEKGILKGIEKDFKNYRNPDNDSNGPWKSGDPSAKSGGTGTYFEIKNPYTGKVDLPPKGRFWAFNKDSLEKYINNGKIIFRKEYKEKERGFIFKTYLNQLGSKYKPIDSLMFTDNIYMNQNATKELNDMDIFFNYSKPVDLMIDLIKYFMNDRNGIVLDFFSGSATIAHSVIQQNIQDRGNRKFIMVQLPELTEEKSEAYKAGYKNICEIGKERIRRAGDKIVSENKDKEGIENLDIGFKVFKLDYNKGGNKMYNEKLIELSNKTNIMNPMKIEILTNKKPKELKGKKKIATINKDADYKVQVFIDDDYNLYYQDNHAFASCESKIVDNKVETTWNSCKCWFKISGLYECRNNHIVDILRDLNSYSEYLYPKNNVADNMALSRLYEQMVNIYLDYVNN